MTILRLRRRKFLGLLDNRTEIEIITFYPDGTALIAIDQFRLTVDQDRISRRVQDDDDLPYW